jgi:hypothetical protein
MADANQVSLAAFHPIAFAMNDSPSYWLVFQSGRIHEGISSTIAWLYGSHAQRTEPVFLSDSGLRPRDLDLAV